MKSLAKIVFGVCCCTLFTGCGGGSSTSANNNSQSALLEITGQNKTYAATAGLMAPVVAAYVSGDIVELPVVQNRGEAKRVQAQLRSSEKTDTETSETYDCGVRGSFTYTYSYTEDIETYVYNDCMEHEAWEDGYEDDYTINGWERYTYQDVAGYEDAYVYEDSTTYETTDNDGNHYVETYQSRMTCATNGNGDYLIKDADYTSQDKGTWYGLTYDYTLAGQKVSVTVDPVNGLTMAGRIGAWGTYYTGEMTMNGMLDMITSEPVFFAENNEYGAYAPNSGKIRMTGNNSSHIDVNMISSGFWMALNDEAAEFVAAPQ